MVRAATVGTPSERRRARISPAAFAVKVSARTFWGSIVPIAAADKLLDAIAFSRGRFALEAAGQETLYLPSWPEISRVIEDCR